MACVNIYLNFTNQTEAAFEFYKKVFRTDFSIPIARFKDIPMSVEENTNISEADANLVMHVELPIFNCIKLMGTDAPQSMGFEVVYGNNVHISLEPNSRQEASDLFEKLSEGGKVSMPIQDMFWGAYYGSLTDKFGVHWMLNFPNTKH